MKYQRDSPSLFFRYRCCTALAISSFLLLFLTRTASALDPHRLISQYAHTVWRVQDGFPHAPHMITQTSDGYIWIAGGGLIRFDGVTLTPVPPQQSFPTDAGINWLLGSRDGSLWMGTYRGLYRLKDGEAFSSPIKIGGVQSILEDNDGAIWVTRTRVLGVDGSSGSLETMRSATQRTGAMATRPVLRPPLRRTAQEISGSDARCYAAGTAVR